jgi:Armadillo/beta-catenin-like repeat
MFSILSVSKVLKSETFLSIPSNFRNKINIVKAGALGPIINLLQSKNQNVQDNATAAMLTLTACSANKPAICFCGAIPPLVSILSCAINPQTKIDSLMALYNLSTLPDSLPIIVSSNPIPSLVALLKTVRKSSKTAEKCMALLEPLLGFEDGRAALTAEPGGVLSVVELLEEGSSTIKEFAVCALLTMCDSDRKRYREVILKEGVIPGLLELSVKGTTAKSRSKARTLLQLLRDSPHPRPELEPLALENIVSDIVLQVDGGDRAGKAKKMLAEMVQVSMEQSLRHMQQRALMCKSNPSK